MPATRRLFYSAALGACVISWFIRESIEILGRRGRGQVEGSQEASDEPQNIVQTEARTRIAMPIRYRPTSNPKFTRRATQ
jgi:hypothetical protein